MVSEATSIKRCELVLVIVMPGPGVFETTLSGWTRHLGFQPTMDRVCVSATGISKTFSGWTLRKR